MRLALNWGSRCYCFDSALRKFDEGYRLILRMKIRVAIGVLTMGLILELSSRIRPLPVIQISMNRPLRTRTVGGVGATVRSRCLAV